MGKFPRGWSVIVDEPGPVSSEEKPERRRRSDGRYPVAADVAYELIGEAKSSAEGAAALCGSAHVDKPQPANWLLPSFAQNYSWSTTFNSEL
jgi:hypothetical protein